ncbi:MAG: DUF3604 domain-containing protein [Parvibaculum sp.]
MNRKHLAGSTSLIALVALASASAATAADTQLLWGDTHLHTAYSTDAFLAGNRDADPDTAYRLAKGEPVIHPFNRTRVQIARPLDFLVVADHAEGLGVMGELNRTDPDLANYWFWQRWKSSYALGRFRDVVADPAEGTATFLAGMPQPAVKAGDKVDPVTTGNPTGLFEFLTRLTPEESIHEISAGMWSKSVAAAEAHNQPGKFSAMIGWEWTQTNNGVNLHRVVMSTLDGETAATMDPVGTDNAPYPEDLWAKLGELTSTTGARFLSIPHNSNLSKGYMFSDTLLNGDPMTVEYAQTRAEWEPVAEITQIKGDSETHPTLSPNDEFADFEQFNFYLQAVPQGGPSVYTAGKGDFVRTGLMRGLEIENRLGVNPYQFGVIGSTDAHTSISSPDEPNFWGKVSLDSIPENKRRIAPDANFQAGVEAFDGWNMSAAGLAAAWATENTRDAIFDAFTRKEVYATTGPRISLRVFGGWGFDETATEAEDIADIGYASGVPMGGDLSSAPEATPVQLLIRATRDPMGANLDRVQVVKGWLDDNGTAQEKVFDVIWSDDRVPDASGKLPPVGNTVDTRTGHFENSIGAPELSAIWQDPDFNMGQAAFYYVRVLEIPTIRHSQLDAVALQIDTPFEGPATLQERAYSSPIWYKPGN